MPAFAGEPKPFYSEATRLEILRLRTRGCLFSEIAKKLDITESGACKAFKRMVKRGSVKDLPRSGRPRKIPQKEMREIKLSLVRKKIATAREIQTYLKEVTAPKPVTVSTTTIRNSLKREGFYPYKVVAKPALTAKQKRERVRLAKKWRESIDDWSTVVFSDETTIKEAPRGRNQYQWQRKGTCFADRRKRPKRLFGGKTIRLWAAITHKKVLAWRIFESDLTAKAYQEILKRSLIPRAEKEFKDHHWWFQQDNASPHVAKSTIEWLEEVATSRGFDILDWAPHSADLNLIENLWSEISNEIALDALPRSSSQLKKYVEKVMARLSTGEGEEYFQKLYKSVPDRLDAIIEGKGEFLSL